MQFNGVAPSTTRYEAEPALAFGNAVRAFRLELSVAQEELAALAGVARWHMGEIGRGEHLPALALVLKIAAVLKISGTELMAATEHNMQLRC